MTFRPDDWPRVKALFDAALEVDGAARAAFVAAACGDDADLRRQVETLLVEHERAGGFLDTPARGGVEPPPDPEWIGRTIGTYRVTAKLGAGGMARSCALPARCSYSYTSGQNRCEPIMQIATVAQVKNQLSKYLARARQRREPIVVTHHGKPYALIQPISERDLDMLDWNRLAEQRLRDAWAGEDDALYDDV